MPPVPPPTAGPPPARPGVGRTLHGRVFALFDVPIDDSEPPMVSLEAFAEIPLGDSIPLRSAPDEIPVER